MSIFGGFYSSGGQDRRAEVADLRYFIDVLITVSSTSLGWFQLNKRTPASLNCRIWKRENRFLPLVCFCSVCFACDYPTFDPQNLFQQDVLILGSHVSYRHLAAVFKISVRSGSFLEIMWISSCVSWIDCYEQRKLWLTVPDRHTAPERNGGPFPATTGNLKQLSIHTTEGWLLN